MEKQHLPLSKLGKAVSLWILENRLKEDRSLGGGGQHRVGE